MPIKYCTHMISRKEIQSNPNQLYVFGDNMTHQGYGGQAKEMRGELNSIGIPTKYFPAMIPTAFFTDDSWKESSVQQVIILALFTIEEALLNKQIVNIPKAGIGTGLAELPKRAPMIYNYIIDALTKIEYIYRKERME